MELSDINEMMSKWNFGQKPRREKLHHASEQYHVIKSVENLQEYSEPISDEEIGYIKPNFINYAKSDKYLDDERENLVWDYGPYLVYDHKSHENFLRIQLFRDDCLISGHGNITQEESTLEPSGLKVGCGTVRGVYKLDHNFIHKYKLKMNTCNTQGCPICFPKWASKIARNAASDYWAKHQEIKMYGNEYDMKLYHTTFSLDPEFYNFWEYDYYHKFQTLLVKIMKKFHRGKYFAASFVKHPYRSKKYCKLCDARVDGKAKKCPNCGNFDKELAGVTISAFYNKNWEQGIHFHVVTNFSPDTSLESWKQTMKEYKFIYTNISVKSYNYKRNALIREFTVKQANAIQQGYSLDFSKEMINFHKENLDCIVNEKQLYRILRYELGHAYYNPNKRHKAISRYGFFLSSKYKIEKIKDQENYTSPVLTSDPVSQMIKDEAPKEESLERFGSFQSLGKKIVEVPYYEIEFSGTEKLEGGALKILKSNAPPGAIKKYLKLHYTRVECKMKKKYIENPFARVFN
jgi:hypothetical protein